MIRNITLTNRAATHFKPIESGLIPDSISFTSGVNVIVGESGSGKSALLYFLACLLHCSTGRQVINPESIGLVQYGGKTISGFNFDHTGAPACYYSPHLFPKRITGAQRATIITSLFDHHFPKLKNIPEARKVLSSYILGDNSAAEYNRVYLMDSIEEGLSMEAMCSLLNLVGGFSSFNSTTQEYEPLCQVILATNNPYILAIPGINIIEFTANYAEKMAAVYSGLMGKVMPNLLKFRKE